VLAVQMPNQLGAPSHIAVADVVATAKWRERLRAARQQTPVLRASDYFRLLSPNARMVDAWTTEYLHVLPASRDGVHPVVAWIMGTTLTPYLTALPQDLQRAFVDDVSQRIAEAYPAVPDGRVLFPFRRLFLVASRKPL
jgi:trans-aconitate 2-methyltransferase